jgi:hypothetical protein
VATKIADETAMAFLNMAREYQDAANELFKRKRESPQDSSDHRPLSSPLSLMYFHTLELGSKAFLRANGLPIEGTSRRSHKLTQLYKECRTISI